MPLTQKFKICLITPPLIESPGYFYSLFEEALSSGIRFVQFRNKQFSNREAFPIALELRRICSRHQSLFVINDDLDLALAAAADGVHIGQEDFPLEWARRLLGPEKIIGVSTHSLKEAAEAERSGADYIGFGSVFPTSSKPDAYQAGLDLLNDLRKQISIPVYAIGGISPANVSSVMETGIAGVAVISGIWDRPSVREAVLEFNQKFLESLPRGLTS